MEKKQPSSEQDENSKDYKDTLNLPKTDFSMKANLSQKEPEMLLFWEHINLVQKMNESRKNQPLFFLHDGPPYANGHIHHGHLLNKVLKDFVIKTKTLEGFYAPYIPGWDCHGLPIELQVDKTLGDKKAQMSVADIRKACRQYANEFIEVQKNEFKRLGVFGDWEHPYKTMDFSYQSQIIREFGTFVKQGLVYKGKKPVHWCVSCATALAEAEVEYENHISPSVYVNFKLKNPEVFLQTLGVSSSLKPGFVIWTTTPWTLPANQGVCLHPDFEYVLYISDLDFENTWIVAKDLLSSFLKSIKREKIEQNIVTSFYAKDIEHLILKNNLVCVHPLFQEKESKVILGDHVTLEAGTGCVHTAPGHGVEDYIVGKKYQLPIFNPVNNHGVFTSAVQRFEGMFVFKANSVITQELAESGLLLNSTKDTLEHSYPHCWRCHHPVIFRATTQWFASLDRINLQLVSESNATLRQQTLDEIDRVQWIPKWGRERIYGMIQNRPDWCLSRQRKWGVPIPVFYCQHCYHQAENDDNDNQTGLILDPSVIDHVALLVEKEGADIWWEKSASELLPTEFSCQSCGNKDFVKETNILDVWFDSGSSFAAVAEKYVKNAKADLYLEGSDQHRGWFHSSLLISQATRNKAPYKAVLTHGFIVNEQGKKYSKSLKNYIPLDKEIQKSGVELLRLWVAASDYRQDIHLSPEILNRTSESYRKIRNTIRFLLGNLFDFDPAKDLVAFEKRNEIDQYAGSILEKFKVKCIQAYQEYEYHKVYHLLNEFCVVDLSQFYLDIVKDRLYCELSNGHNRRSCQSSLFEILRTLLVITSPILCFTSDEAWKFAPKYPSDPESVHLALFDELPSLTQNQTLYDRWNRVKELREKVSKELELQRKEKNIGHSLDAHATIEIAQNDRTYFERFNEADWQQIFIVSKVTILFSEKNTIAVEKSSGQKCNRCWNYFETTTVNKICHRCETVLNKQDSIHLV